MLVASGVGVFCLQARAPLAQQRRGAVVSREDHIPQSFFRSVQPRVEFSQARAVPGAIGFGGTRIFKRECIGVEFDCFRVASERGQPESRLARAFAGGIRFPRFPRDLLPPLPASPA